MRYLLILCLFVQTVIKAQQPVAGKILTFSMSKMGTKVDRGECWDLASAALNHVNADWSPSFNFGDKVTKKDMKPGDIIQFTDISMKFPNGTASFPKHTAIVYKAKGEKVTLIHQNFNNKRYVDTMTIDLNYIQKGKVDVYRPKAK
jgi:hypothetical protein